MSNGPYSYATNLRPPLRTTTVSPRYRSMQAGRLPTGGNVSQMGQSGQEGQGNMGVLTAIAIGSAAASAWGAWRQSKAQAKAARIQGEAADAALQAERDTEMFNRYMKKQELALNLPRRAAGMSMTMARGPKGLWKGPVAIPTAPDPKYYDPEYIDNYVPETPPAPQHAAFGANDQLSDGGAVRGYAPPTAPGPQAARYLQSQSRQPQTMASFRKQRGIAEPDPGAPRRPAGVMNMGRLRNI